jgi:hypothetical protein
MKKLALLLVFAGVLSMTSCVTDDSSSSGTCNPVQSKYYTQSTGLYTLVLYTGVGTTRNINVSYSEYISPKVCY